MAEAQVIRDTHRRERLEDMSAVTKRRRFKALVPDLGACEDCGKPATHRHHEDGDIDHISRDNMAVLCTYCHRQRHVKAPALTGTFDALVVRLETLRQEQRLTHTEFAVKLGVGRATWLAVRSGKRAVGNKIRYMAWVTFRLREGLEDHEPI